MSGSGRSDRRVGAFGPDMRTTSRGFIGCLFLALLTGLVGIGLRHAVAVTPVDVAFRAVLRAYAAPEPSGTSNTGETSPP